MSELISRLAACRSTSSSASSSDSLTSTSGCAGMSTSRRRRFDWSGMRGREVAEQRDGSEPARRWAPRAARAAQFSPAPASRHGAAMPPRPALLAAPLAAAMRRRRAAADAGARSPARSRRCAPSPCSTASGAARRRSAARRKQVALRADRAHRSLPRRLGQGHRGPRLRRRGGVRFNALGIVSFDPATRAYTLHSHALGRVGDFAFVPTGDGYRWEIPLPAGAALRRDRQRRRAARGRRPHRRRPRAVRVFEMRLKRIGDTDWPAAGAVPE